MDFQGVGWGVGCRSGGVGWGVGCFTGCWMHFQGVGLSVGCFLRCGMHFLFYPTLLVLDSVGWTNIQISRELLRGKCWMKSVGQNTSTCRAEGIADHYWPWAVFYGLGLCWGCFWDP